MLWNVFLLVVAVAVVVEILALALLVVVLVVVADRGIDKFLPHRKLVVLVHR